LSKNEIGFSNFIVKPLWDSLNIFLDGDLAISLSHIEKNIKEWEIIGDVN